MTAVLLLIFSAGSNAAMYLLLRAARREHVWIMDHDSHGVTVVIRPDATYEDYARARRELDARTPVGLAPTGGAR